MKTEIDKGIQIGINISKIIEPMINKARKELTEEEFVSAVRTIASSLVTMTFPPEAIEHLQKVLNNQDAIDDYLELIEDENGPTH